MSDQNVSPTLALYSQLQAAFDHFNKALFGANLPPCLLTLRSASRVYGYHHAGRFIAHDGRVIDEVGLNPGFFTLQPIESVLATLVHEMVHHWQNHAGSPSPANPHNREWSDKMFAIGLQPSSTGLPGGKKTGRSMSDYILPGGRFIASCKVLLESGFSLTWMDRHAPAQPEKVEATQRALEAAGIAVAVTSPPINSLPEEVAGKPTVWEPPPKKPPSRFKFKCPQCETEAWAGPDADILCGICHRPLEPEHAQGLES